jgi:hypothetical protein
MAAQGGGREGVGVASARNVGVGGILVILGIVLIIVWNLWWGLIIAVVGLVLLGGFTRGRWL